MKVLLRNISTIQTGLFARPTGFGELVYLQSKHFDEYGQLNTELYPDLSAEGISEKHLLSKDDVLFAAKGTKNFAAVFDNHNAPSVASTSFFVIRITDINVLPSYLAWYLNHLSLKSSLKGKAKGSAIPSITKKDLEELEIAIPEIQIQRTVIKLDDLRNREKALRQKIEFLREHLIEQQIIRALK